MGNVFILQQIQRQYVRQIKIPSLVNIGKLIYSNKICPEIIKSGFNEKESVLWKLFSEMSSVRASMRCLKSTFAKGRH